MAVEQQSDILKDRVQGFTAQHLGVKSSKLSTASRLNRYLGMDGDDAAEFFKDFAAEFKVNLDDLYALVGTNISGQRVGLPSDSSSSSLRASSLASGCETD